MVLELQVVKGQAPGKRQGKRHRERAGETSVCLQVYWMVGSHGVLVGATSGSLIPLEPGKEPSMEAHVVPTVLICILVLSASQECWNVCQKAGQVG